MLRDTSILQRPKMSRVLSNAKVRRRWTFGTKSIFPVLFHLKQNRNFIWNIQMHLPWFQDRIGKQLREKINLYSIVRSWSALSKTCFCVEQPPQIRWSLSRSGIIHSGEHVLFAPVSPLRHVHGVALRAWIWYLVEPYFFKHQQDAISIRACTDIFSLKKMMQFTASNLYLIQTNIMMKRGLELQPACSHDTPEC